MYFSVVLVYLEIEFSKYKELKSKYKEDEDNDGDVNDEKGEDEESPRRKAFFLLETKMKKLIFYLHEMEFCLERVIQFNKYSLSHHQLASNLLPRSRLPFLDHVERIE
jgi:hypothetical protein